VLFDDLKYKRKEWQNRNKIVDLNKGWMWLTVPVNSTSLTKLNEVRIDTSINWQKKHWNAIMTNYNKTFFFKHYKNFFKKVYSRRWDILVNLNKTIIMYILKELKIQTKIVESSKLNLEDKKTNLIIKMCKQLRADCYLSGKSGHEYLDEQKFSENGVTLLYQDFFPSVYPQRITPFIPNMSVIDLMFNMGNKESRRLILESGSITQVN